jgi:hypothetical protein
MQRPAIAVTMRLLVVPGRESLWTFAMARCRRSAGGWDAVWQTHRDWAMDLGYGRMMVAGVRCAMP